jgi:hypothetical protein
MTRVQPTPLPGGERFSFEIIRIKWKKEFIKRGMLILGKEGKGYFSPAK